MEATWKSYELPGPLQAEIYISCRNSAAGKLMCFPLFHCGLLFYWKFVESIAHLHNISVSKMLFLFGRMFWLKNPNCVKQVYLGLCNVAWTLYICGDIKAEEATSFFISAKVIFSKSQPLEKAMASRHFRSNSLVVGVFPSPAYHPWPQQLLVFGRMKVKLWIIMSSKSFFFPLSALDHLFMPQSTEFIIHTPWSKLVTYK